MFTPQEVSEKVFPKSSGFGGGYQMAAVDTFLDSLTEDYTALYKENMTLKAKLKILAEKVEEYRATEDSMRATLLTAQKMAAKLVQEAQAEKDNLVSQARADAAAEIAALDQQVAEAKTRLAGAQSSLRDYIAQSTRMLDQQRAFLEQLPEADYVKYNAAPVQEDTEVAAIEAKILETFAPAAAEEPAEEAEVPAAPAVEQTPAPEPAPAADDFEREFRLSLDELKFGRNFGEE